MTKLLVLYYSTYGHIETIDMARRAIHNEAADALMEQLAPRLTIDLYTARRLFRLICLLELRG